MRVVLLIDGGNLRALARQAKQAYSPAFVRAFATSCVAEPEQLLRILYYDCPPFAGKVQLPVSGATHVFSATDAFLTELSHMDLVAIRRGTLKFRGFEPRKLPIGPAELTDDDFKPVFQQKGVDLRIGLDIANYADGRIVDRVLLMTQDADLVPAMKRARRAGIQVVLIKVPNSNLVGELREHADLVRLVAWPGE